MVWLWRLVYAGIRGETHFFMSNSKTKSYRALCVASLTALALFASGCASIVHGGNRSISIGSDPQGAKVTVCKEGSTQVVSEGKTPCTVLLDPKGGYFKAQDYNITIELPGYKAAQVSLRHELSGWYFGNILLGGLIGMIVVDPCTGSMWDLTPDKIEQKLTPEQAALIKNKTGFVVVLAAQLTPSEKANAVRLN